jgi:hypothetical protein
MELVDITLSNNHHSSSKAINKVATGLHHHNKAAMPLLILHSKAADTTLPLAGLPAKATVSSNKDMDHPNKEEAMEQEKEDLDMEHSRMVHPVEEECKRITIRAVHL